MLSIALIATGIGTIGFPFGAQWLNAKALSRLGDQYVLVTNQASAKRYQRALAANEVGDHASALQELTHDASDVIARVRIPSIKVDLPVYPSASDENLQRGIGWLPSTSAPVGGSGTHAVLTGHSGMPTHRMFDRLPRLGVDDLIFLDVLGQTLIYRVTGTLVDTPESGSKHLQPVGGQDLLTLVTCTPYGVNTHRLLVTAQRTSQGGLQASKESTRGPNAVDSSQSTRPWLRPVLWAGVALGVGAAVIVTGMRLSPHRRSGPVKKPRHARD